MEVILALVIVIGATAVILNLSRFAERSPFSVSGLEYINTQSKYQALLLSVAMLVLLATYFVNGAHLGTFLAPGNIAAPAKGGSWLGLAERGAWLRPGSRP